jgi:hypothetical protein
MKNELIKATVFFMIGMIFSFGLILYKNNWTIYFNGNYINIL